jgi:hypothetical protein
VGRLLATHIGIEEKKIKSRQWRRIEEGSEEEHVEMIKRPVVWFTYKHEFTYHRKLVGFCENRPDQIHFLKICKKNMLKTRVKEKIFGEKRS